MEGEPLSYGVAIFFSSIRLTSFLSFIEKGIKYKE